MNPNSRQDFIRGFKTPLLIAISIIIVGLVSWSLGRSSGSKETDNTASSDTSSQNTNTVAKSSEGYDIKSLVSYTLPAGWKEKSCSAVPGTIYIEPSGSNTECSETPNSPVTIAVDPSNRKDCNQLQNVKDVSKHICISEYINGQRSLNAETVYNKDSTYNEETVVKVYYVDTGKGVVKVEYTYNPNDSEYRVGFDELARSLKVK